MWQNNKLIAYSIFAILLLGSISLVAGQSQDFWWDGESFYWKNQIENCTSQSIKFVKPDGTNRLTRAISEKEHQYCPFFDDWDYSMLLCGSSEANERIYKSSSAEITQCFDSDAGKDYYQFGFVKDASNLNYDYVVYDRCDGDILHESFCRDNVQWTYTHLCPNGCYKGMCKKTDDDPWAAIWIEGATIHYSAINMSSGGAVSLKLLKKNGCNRLTRAASDSGGSYTPYFDDWATVVLQQYVSGRGYIHVSNTLMREDSIECTDSDGGEEYYVKGSAYGPQPETGVYGTSEDYCSGDRLYEATCAYDEHLGTYARRYVIHLCDNGCEDGACIVSPNLIISNIRISPENPVIGERVRLFATIENIGNAPAVIESNNGLPSLFVQWKSRLDYKMYWSDGEPTGKEEPINCGHSFGNNEGVYPAGESFEQEICGGFIFKPLQSGTDTMTVSVNLEPNNNVNESNYNDNTASANFDIFGCTHGDTRPCGQCREGTMTCYDGTWGECIGDRIPSEEVCDGVDNDCDGEIDEGGVCQGGYCGDGICEFTTLDICEGGSENISVYGIDHVALLLGISDENTAIIKIDEASRTLDVGSTRRIWGVDTYLQSIWRNDIYVAVAIGPNPMFSMSGYDPSNYTLRVNYGINLWPGSLLRHGDYLSGNHFTTVLDNSDLPTILADGTFEDDDGYVYDYRQHITIGRRHILYSDSQNDDCLDGRTAIWDVGTYANDPLYTMSVVFEDEIDFSNPDVGGNMIDISGIDFIISHDSDENTLVLYGGANKQTLSEGETATISVDGVSYDVSLIGVSDSDTVVVKVGDVSRTIDEGLSRTIGGLEVYVEEVYFLSKEEQVSAARLLFGSSTLTLNDGYEVLVGTGLDEDDIDNTFVTFTQGTGGTSRIDIAVAAPDIDGDFVSMDRRFTDPVFGSFKFALADLTEYAEWKDIECGSYSAPEIGAGARFVFGETTMDCENDCTTYVVACYQDSDCGETYSTRYCSGDNACTSHVRHDCYNPGTRDARCGASGGGGCVPCDYGCEDGYCIEGTCRNGDTVSCGPSTDIGICRRGVQTCENNMWSACVGAVLPMEEICYNNLDDDCDGSVDEGCREYIYLYLGLYPNHVKQGETAFIRGSLYEYSSSNETIQFFEDAFIKIRVYDPEGNSRVLSMEKSCRSESSETYNPYTYTQCEFSANYTGTSITGDYVIEAIPNEYVINQRPSISEEEEMSFPKILIRNSTFNVYDPAILQEKLILEDIDGYRYVDSMYQPPYAASAETFTGYIAIYSKDANYTALIYEFSSEEKSSEFINNIFDHTSYDVIERNFNNKIVYELISTQSLYDSETRETRTLNFSIFVWKKDEFMAAILPYGLYSPGYGEPYEEPVPLIEAYLGKYPSDINVICGNGICDIDETIDSCPQDCGGCSLGDTRQCGQTDEGVCEYGFEYCINYTWSDCMNETRPIPEVCNNDLDDDCDGLVDEECFDDKVNVNVWLGSPEINQGENLIVSVSVTDWNGNRLENSNVSLLIKPGNSIYHGQTDQNGMWTEILKIGSIDPGEYTITVTANYQDYDQGMDEKSFVVKASFMPVNLNDEITMVNLAQVAVKMEAITVSLGEIKRTVNSIINYYSVKNPELVPVWQEISNDTELLIADVHGLQEMIGDFIVNPSDKKLDNIKENMNEISMFVKDLVNKILEAIRQ